MWQARGQYERRQGGREKKMTEGLRMMRRMRERRDPGDERKRYKGNGVLKMNTGR